MRHDILTAYDHQDLPFERLVEELRPRRDAGHNPICQVVFAVQNAPSPPFELPGLKVTPLEIANGTAKFDLELSVYETKPGLLAVLNYSTELFEPATASAILDQFRVLLEDIVADPDRPLTELAVLSAGERHKLLREWNETDADYPADTCIHGLFAAQAARSSAAVALVWGAGTLTYGDLNRRANQLAHALRSRGTGPEVVVAVCMDRSPEMIVAYLGILKAGGAYLPVAPTLPSERLLFMIDEARSPIVLTQQRWKDKLTGRSAGIFCLDTEWEVVAGESEDNPPPTAIADNPAYVIYTSESTGRPKGVVLTHKSLVNLVTWHQRQYGVTGADRATHLAAPSFDASVWELWPYLTGGATVYLVAGELAASTEIFTWLATWGITVCFLPTPLAEAVLETPPPEGLVLRALLVGGDKLRKPPRYPLPFVLANHYGPTENTVVTTSAIVTGSLDSAGPPPIGRPIANVRLYILDGNLKPVPVGAAGELYIGGAGLARGYLNQPGLTAERFVPDPFGDVPGGRLYRTGDLVRYRGDGSLEFLCRADRQVKIRGFRIEPAEIEAVLLQHDAVAQAVVEARDDALGQTQLVAYFVPAPGSAPEPAALRHHLTAFLPEYMVPASLLALAALPLTANGELDRSALPAPENTLRDPKASFPAPRDDTERALAEIWQRILGRDRVGIDDNFFELGGHSLLAMRLVSLIRENLGHWLPINAVFQAPTIERLAALLRPEAPGSPADSSFPGHGVGVSKRPLFCLSWGPTLAQHLGVYPIYPLDLDQDELRAITRIEDTATYLIKKMRTVQPEGPYLLGGFCARGHRLRDGPATDHNRPEG